MTDPRQLPLPLTYRITLERTLDYIPISFEVSPPVPDPEDRLTVTVYGPDGRVVSRTVGPSRAELAEAHASGTCARDCGHCYEEAVRASGLRNPCAEIHLPGLSASPTCPPCHCTHEAGDSPCPLHGMDE